MARLLVVDDEPNILDLVKGVLEGAGYEVQTSSSPEEALALLEDAATPLPDLVVSDVMMPGMDGYTFVTRLSQGERTKSLKVLIITARGKLDDVFQGVPNVVGFVHKVGPLEDFRKAVADALARP